MRLILFLAFAMLASSQTLTRAAQGIVTDGESKPLSGAVVQLENTRTLTIRSFITQEDGTFHFNGLLRDEDYEITVRYKGLKSTARISKFDEHDPVKVRLRMEVGSN